MSTSRQLYIEEFSEYAMSQMRKYGIPASITLAQGIIESANGKSMLATTANNHFGVKGEYNGEYVLANDDRPNEKFKKYDEVGQSYEDHSKVLLADRYQKYTKNLSPADYRGWAAAIKKGGYATASNYESTIISIIESNNLQKYDQIVMDQMQKDGRGLRKSGSENEGYSMPVKRESFFLVTSPYGQRQDPLDRSSTQIHHGIDIKTQNEVVLATENGGTVINIDPRTTTGGGKTVTVEYKRADGSYTQVQYMHLSEISVRKGDLVNAGQQLGISGNTGSRTTGEHLHLGVVCINADGKKQWMNPASYLSEINQKGNLHIEALYNGVDLLERYKSPVLQQKDQAKERDFSMQKTPALWMDRLVSSDDAALGYFGGDSQGLLDSILQMFMTLLMFAMNSSRKSVSDKIEATTEALISKTIDLSSFVSNLKSAEITLQDDGKTVLNTNDGQQQYLHLMTDTESKRLSQILHSDIDDTLKRQRIGNMINAITYTEQASKNYEQIENQLLIQEQNLQRK